MSKMSQLPLSIQKEDAEESYLHLIVRQDIWTEVIHITGKGQAAVPPGSFWEVKGTSKGMDLVRLNDQVISSSFIAQHNTIEKRRKGGKRNLECGWI